MANYCITFSPTGGVNRVADILAGALHSQWTLVDLMNETILETTETDVCLVAVPSFGGRVADFAAQRLKGITGPAKAIAVCVYGNRAYEDALLELRNTLTGIGCRVIAAAAFIAEHSIIRSIAAARPDAADLAKAVEFGNAVQGKLIHPEPSLVEVPGNAEYRPLPQMPATPLVTESCGGCGMCARKCPTGGIPLSNPRSTDADKCILCMRCVAICPRKSRILPPPMVEAFTARLTAVASEPKQPELFI